jgi:type I restriction enzyme R subunit
MSHIDMEDLYSLVFGHLSEDDERRESFLQAELRLSAAFLLVKHIEDCLTCADELIFYQRVRKQLTKALPGLKPKQDLERAVRDLVDDSVSSEEVVDIYQTAGLDKPDLSILDDAFLQTFKDKPHENLRLKLLEQLLRNEINERQKKNLAKAKSFRELLEATIQRYHNRLIDAAAVIQEMIKIRKVMTSDDRRREETGLADDELAFYDAVAATHEAVYEQPFLRDLVHQVVQAIKRNLKVDWTESHRDDVRAAISTAVKRVLRRNDVREEDFDPFIHRFMEQAQALYADWPLAA